MTAIDQKTVLRLGRRAAAAAFFINGFVVGSWALQIPSFVTRLGVSEFVLGLLIFCFGLGALFAMTLAGQLVARRGSQWTLRLLTLPVIIILPLVAYTTNVWVAAIILALFGGAIGGMDVAMNANVVAIEKRLGRAIMSSLHGFWSLGGFAGGGLGGIAIQAFGPLEHALVVSVLAAFGMALAYRHIAEDAGEPRQSIRSHSILPKQATIYIIGAMALLSMSAEGSVLSWSALYMKKELMADTVTAGLAFAGFSGAMALTRFCGDSIRNRYGAVATFRMSGIVAALSMLAVGLSPWPWLAIVAFASCGVGLANLAPILFSTAGNQPGLNAGVSLSILTTMGHSGILFAPSLIGFVGGLVGLAWVYIAFAILLSMVSLLSGKTAAADA
ncbi:putative MFS family arabinose efflux permease [Rhizobium sp. PP-F2F-G48]|uniref:MFS transporter n=1 Tax=Rhizobium sp. PP-F2F-G48 TaxID=2135651 RepID=UPI0010445CC3|nr:MFS transporter [Rhizobium sp. PP-F2F-G48]TCM51090.1 putative MFS family arabinose efflux permease [Rhizobium sp. PP-F2F-G48]